MGAKAVYRSINDGNVGRIGLGTRLKRRLRLKGLFGKKDNVNPDAKKVCRNEFIVCVCPSRVAEILTHGSLTIP